MRKHKGWEVELRGVKAREGCKGWRMASNSSCEGGGRIRSCEGEGWVLQGRMSWRVSVMVV